MPFSLSKKRLKILDFILKVSELMWIYYYYQVQLYMVSFLDSKNTAEKYKI